MPFFLISQEISQTYLDSLPDNIKDDVMNKIEERKSLEENVYRSIDSSSEIPKIIDNENAIFGYHFFNTIQTSFMPINNPNLDDEYVLDVGDILGIQLVGKNDSFDSYQLSRDGSINIPDIGKLSLAGLSLGNASSLISAKAKQTFIGVEAYTTLENLRDVSVLVSGDAYNPGIYTLNGNSNMLHAIHSAGGIGDYGSYRSIKLIRNNKVIDSIDVYDILIKGKITSKTRLRNGDIIFVDPRNKIITLEGAFKRSHRYELLASENLSDAINFANGVTADADLSNIFLYRVSKGKIRDIAISNLSQLKDIEANDLDRILIRRHSFRDVQITGAVDRPGNYKMIEGDQIYDLIKKAGGYSSNAFPGGAIYLNEYAKKVNIEASEKLYNQFIDSLLEILQTGGASADGDITPLMLIAEEIKDSEPNGRMIIDLNDESESVMLQNGDSLFIPEKTNNVYIYGEVLNSGPLIYKKGASLDFYLSEASGTKETADSSAIYILYPNGRTKKFNRKRNIFASQPQVKNLSIEPGSIIYVPRKIDDTLSSRLTAQAYASILGNIGLTLASISSINKN